MSLSVGRSANDKRRLQGWDGNVQRCSLVRETSYKPRRCHSADGSKVLKQTAKEVEIIGRKHVHVRCEEVTRHGRDVCECRPALPSLTDKVNDQHVFARPRGYLRVRQGSLIFHMGISRRQSTWLSKHMSIRRTSSMNRRTR